MNTVPSQHVLQRSAGLGLAASSSTSSSAASPAAAISSRRLIDLFGRPEDRPLARLGYYIAFPCVVLSGLLLTLDLGRPRALLAHADPVEHVSADVQVLVADVGRLVGAADLRVVFTSVASLSALAEDDRLAWPAARRLRPPGMLRIVIAVIGGLFGFYVAGYTGVLLAVTNRPDLVRHAAARYAVRGVGRVDLGGFDDSACASIQMDHAGRLRRCTAWTAGWSRWNLSFLIAVMISLGRSFGPG